MNEYDDLHELLGPLRSVATPAELASEADIVDAMARNHRNTKGSTTMFSSRRNRIAALVAAGVLGFGGMAAAENPGASIDLSQLTITDDANTGETNAGETNTGETNTGETNTGETNTGETNTGETNTGESNTGETNTELAEVASEEIVVDDEPDLSVFPEEYCLEGNHGKTVSARARGKDKAGALVSAEFEERGLTPEDVDAFFDDYPQSVVAQSSCGKGEDDMMSEEGEGVEEENEEKSETESESQSESENESESEDDGDETEKPVKVEKTEKTQKVVEKTEKTEKSGRPDHAGSKSNGKKGRG